MSCAAPCLAALWAPYASPSARIERADMGWLQRSPWGVLNPQTCLMSRVGRGVKSDMQVPLFRGVGHLRRRGRDDT